MKLVQWGDWVAKAPIGRVLSAWIQMGDIKKLEVRECLWGGERKKSTRRKTSCLEGGLVKIRNVSAKGKLGLPISEMKVIIVDCARMISLFLKKAPGKIRKQCSHHLHWFLALFQFLHAIYCIKSFTLYDNRCFKLFGAFNITALWRKNMHFEGGNTEPIAVILWVKQCGGIWPRWV